MTFGRACQSLKLAGRFKTDKFSRWATPPREVTWILVSSGDCMSIWERNKAVQAKLMRCNLEQVLTIYPYTGMNLNSEMKEWLKEGSGVWDRAQEWKSRGTILCKPGSTFYNVKLFYFFSGGRSTRSNFYFLFNKGRVTIAKKVPGENRSLDPWGRWTNVSFRDLADTRFSQEFPWVVIRETQACYHLLLFHSYNSDSHRNLSRGTTQEGII
jgi:hypothetical protein